MLSPVSSGNSLTVESRNEGGLVVVRRSGPAKIRRLLIANRGEIACRIITTCKTLGVVSIAVYAQEDRDSLHVEAADEAICVGSIGDSTGNPYQNAGLLVQTALSAKADAIHPGYGYLSENAAFARAVKQAKLIFVGPSPEAISVLGDKRQAKDFLRKNAPQVPLIPSYNGTEQDAQTLETKAEAMGFPVLIKAAAGGGGRGMRVVRKRESLRDELSRAQSEAQRSFGSSDCLLERFIERSKHIEVQIFGDCSGNIVSLFERECSIQRRHQKIIEEAPSPSLTAVMRSKMIETAKTIGRLLQYENAGTVEFILDVDSNDFYFLEVNTRIQVEHPITEETTGVDIVALQLFVAAGGLLKDTKFLSNVSQFGHSIECRLCAEDPAREFMPDSGTILRWSPGLGPLDIRQVRDVRIETAVKTGSTVSVHFDSMIAKIVVKAEDRREAISKMTEVLRRTTCSGIKTNLLFLQASLMSPAFSDPGYTTNFVAEQGKVLLANPHYADPSSMMEGFCFAAPLLLRWGMNALREGSAHRPFSSIRRGFRNQVYDYGNRTRDVVCGDPSAGDQQDRHTYVINWHEDGISATDEHAYTIKRLTPPIETHSQSPKDSADLKPGAKLISHYNAAFTEILHQPDSGSQIHTVRIVQSHLQKHGPPSQQWVTCDVDVEHDGRMQTLHLATDDAYDSRDTAAPQRIFCHSADIGTSLELHRYTMLAYGESLRAQFQAPEAMSELRVYKSVMPCKVLQVLKKKGDQVKQGETMLVVESMKTEMKMVAAVDGVFEPKVAQGSAVDGGVVLCELLEA